MKFNINFFILLFIAFTACINDLIIYFVGIQYGTSIFISILLSILVSVFLIRKKKIEITLDFNKYDIYIFLIMVFVTLITGIVYPDYTYDVIAYHAYLQKNPFLDKINFDFFPGRIYCVFLFALGDRMFYIFRYFLGYRAGTILSFYLPIVLFYQTKILLKHFGSTDKKSSILSYFIFIVIEFSSNVGNYYIDNIPVIFLFQALIMILTTKNIITEKTNLYTFILLLGIATGIKITSIFFVVPIMIYMLYKNKDDIKNIKIYDLIIGFAIFILPFFVYLLDNIKQTGSPVFPYYNEFFKSPLFELQNWKDERFGINGIINKIFWPIVVNTLYKYGDELHLHDYSWVIGYIFTILFMLKKLLSKEKKDERFELAILSLIFTTEWVMVLEGYMRYGIIIPIIWTIIILSYISEAIKFSINMKIIEHYIYFAIIFVIIISGIDCTINYLDINNMHYVFKDIENKQSKVQIDGVWGSTYDCSVFSSLIREDETPIYCIDRRYFENNPKTLDMWYEKVTNNDIYVVIDNYDNCEFSENVRVKYLERLNFEIEDVVAAYNSDQLPYVNADSIWYIAKVKYIGEK